MVHINSILGAYEDENCFVYRFVAIYSPISAIPIHLYAFCNIKGCTLLPAIIQASLTGSKKKPCPLKPLQCPFLYIAHQVSYNRIAIQLTNVIITIVDSIDVLPAK